MLKEKEKNIRATKSHKGSVTRIEQVSKNTHYIEFETEKPFFSNPGQYVSILCNNLSLRRPFSIAFNKQDRIGVLFKEKGEGTKFIKSLTVGDNIDFIGALGNRFNIRNEKSLLIGAGVGVAPIFYMKNKLEELNIDYKMYSGFSSKSDIPQRFDLGCIFTDDGSFGKKGSVVDYLEEIIENYKPKIIYACGPRIVLQKTAQLAQKHHIASQIAMEKVMACGIGVCRGCVIRIIKNGKEQNATVCKDGPVFKGEEVVW
ncbi:MAG: FAD-binding oxidoreductase [Candidatus Gastranaerophilales bacterium]|nr:FAD-binding oxidoreductase [Candidatus Gastranaerophilales bacterium]